MKPVSLDVSAQSQPTSSITNSAADLDDFYFIECEGGLCCSWGWLPSALIIIIISQRLATFGRKRTDDFETRRSILFDGLCLY